MKTTRHTISLSRLAAIAGGLALAAATPAFAVNLFSENFEAPVVAGYSQGTTPPTTWVKAAQGFNSSYHGLINEAVDGAGTGFEDPVGAQAYAFRYTNSGLTSAAGKIGALQLGVTYTVKVDVVKDIVGTNPLPYTIQLIAFAAGAARDDIRSTPTGSFVLNSKSGNATNDGVYSTVTFTFKAGSAHQAYVGYDLGVRFIGASDSANVDNVSVDADFSSVALWDTNASDTGSGGPTPNGTWGALTDKWNPVDAGTGTVAAWTPGKMAVFAAGSDAIGGYDVTIDGSQDITGLSIEEGTPNLVNGTSGALNLTANSDLFVASGSTLTIGVPLTDADDTQILDRWGTGLLVLNADNSAANGGLLLRSGTTRFDSVLSINGTTRNVTVSGVAMFGPSFGAGSIPTALADRIVTTSAGVIVVDNYDSTAFDFATPGLASAYLGSVANLTYTGLHTPGSATYRLGGGGGTLTLTNTSGMSGNLALDVKGNVVISGNIETGAGTLTKSNTGILTLSGTNTYSGTTTIGTTTVDAGTVILSGSNSSAGATSLPWGILQLNSPSNGGLASGNLTFGNATAGRAVIQAAGTDRAVSNNLVLNLTNATIAGNYSLQINGTFTNSGGNQTLTSSLVSGKTLTLAGQVKLSEHATTGRTLAIAGTGKTVISGAIVNGSTGASSLTCSNAALFLSGLNIYSGDTLVNSTLTMQGKDAVSPNTKFRLGGDSGSAGNGNTMNILSDDSGTVSLGNQVDLRSLQTSAAASWGVFVGNNGGATTGSTIALGKLNFAYTTDNRANGLTLNVTGANGYRLQLGDIDLNVIQANAQNVNPTTAPLTIAGTVKQVNGKLASYSANGAVVTYHSDYFGLGGTATGNLVSGTIKNATDYDNLSNANARPLNVIKSNTSVWSLPTANTYSGATYVTGGTLIANIIANGDTASSIGQSTNATAGLVLGGGTLQYAPISGVGGAGDSTSRNFTITSSSTMNASGTGALVFNAPTGGTISPDVTGLGGSWTTGQKVITGLSSTANLAVGMRVSGTGIVGGQTIASIDSATQVTLSANTTSAGSGDSAFGYPARTLTLTGTNTDANTIAGNLQNSTATGAGVLSLTKSGIGTWVLSGTNRYTGATGVSAGKLFINGDQTAATGAVSVTASGTLGGTGIIGGNTSIANSCGLEFNLSTAAGSHNKLDLAAGKTLTFSGASVLTITSGGGSSAGLYTLVTAPGASSIIGTAPATVNVPLGWTYDPPQIVADGSDTSLQINIKSTGGGSPFATWAGAGVAFDADANNDGVDNGMAWVLGALDKDANAIALLPTMDNTTDPDFFIFTYRRDDDANTDPKTTIKAEYGSTLSAWTTAVAGADIIITPTDDGAGVGIDLVQVKIRRTLAVGGKLLARLNVENTP